VLTTFSKQIYRRGYNRAELSLYLFQAVCHDLWTSDKNNILRFRDIINANYYWNHGFRSVAVRLYDTLLNNRFESCQLGNSGQEKWKLYYGSVESVKEITRSSSKQAVMVQNYLS